MPAGSRSASSTTRPWRATHFETLDKLAVTPMSRARAAYWRARAAEASASADAGLAARAFYQAAAVLSLDLLRPARPRQARFERRARADARSRGDGRCARRFDQGRRTPLRHRRERSRHAARRRSGAPSRRSGAGRGAGARRRKAAGRACVAHHRQAREPARHPARRARLPDLRRPRISAFAKFRGRLDRLFDRPAGKRF